MKALLLTAAVFRQVNLVIERRDAMFRIKMSLIALIGTLALGACGVQGVSEYQNAIHMGCTPAPTGGVVCSG